MRGHVVLPVELLGADAAGVALPVEVRGHVMPVEVGRVGIGVVAHLAAVRVALLDAEAPDGDGTVSAAAHRVHHAGPLGRLAGGRGRGVGGSGRVVERRQLRLRVLEVEGGEIVVGRRDRRRRVGGVLLRRTRGRVAEPALPVESVCQPLLPELLHVDAVLYLGYDAAASIAATDGRGIGALRGPAGVEPAAEPVLLLEAEVLRLHLHLSGRRVGQLEAGGRGSGTAGRPHAGDGHGNLSVELVAAGRAVSVHVKPLLGHWAGGQLRGRRNGQSYTLNNNTKPIEKLAGRRVNGIFLCVRIDSKNESSE